MDIIKALKENEKPFGLMSEEMQAKAEGIGKENEFQLFNVHGKWNEECSVLGVFSLYETYRLRPGYEEKPYEAWPVDGGNYTITRGDEVAIYPIHGVFSDPDFIGFKYENGRVSAEPRLYMATGKGYNSKGAIQGCTEPNSIENFEVLTPTHVLFRKG